MFGKLFLSSCDEFCSLCDSKQIVLFSVSRVLFLLLAIILIFAIVLLLLISKDSDILSSFCNEIPSELFSFSGEISSISKLIRLILSAFSPLFSCSPLLSIPFSLEIVLFSALIDFLEEFLFSCSIIFTICVDSLFWVSISKEVRYSDSAFLK